MVVKGMFADNHGNLEILDELHDDMDKRGIDKKERYFLGDMIGRGENQIRVLDHMMERMQERVVGGDWDYALRNILRAVISTGDEITREFPVTDVNIMGPNTYVKEVPKSVVKEFLFRRDDLEDLIKPWIKQDDLWMVHAGPPLHSDRQLYADTDTYLDGMGKAENLVFPRMDFLNATYLVHGHTHTPLIVRQPLSGGKVEVMQNFTGTRSDEIRVKLQDGFKYAMGVGALHDMKPAGERPSYGVFDTVKKEFSIVYLNSIH